MPDIKHNFTGGKMNKDLDERLVPNGEYRDAMNIQVQTSEGSEVGAIQNILGNNLGCNYSTTHPNPIPNGSTTVGSISDEKNDSLYWLVAGPVDGYMHSSGLYSYYIKKDMIMRTNKSLEDNLGCQPVFVDIYSYTLDNTDFAVSTNALGSPGIRELAYPGMTATGFSASGSPLFSQTVTNVGALNVIPNIDYSLQPGVSSFANVVPFTGISTVFIGSNTHFAPSGIIDSPPYTMGDSGYYVPTGFYPPALGTLPAVSGQRYLQIKDPLGNLMLNTAGSTYFDYNISADPYGGIGDLVTLTNPDDTAIFQQAFASGTYAIGANVYVGVGAGIGGSVIDMTGWEFAIQSITPQFTNQITISNSTWVSEIDDALNQGLTVEFSPSNSWPVPAGEEACIDPNSIGIGNYYVVYCSDLTTHALPVSSNPVTLNFSSQLTVNAAILAEDVDLSNVSTIEFTLPRVLKFQSSNLIIGLNIIDDMLFWTDNSTEPKKINITRSITGTDIEGQLPTKLIVNGVDKGLVKEEHITVIKRAPKKGVSMTLTTNRDSNLNYSGIFTISDTNNLAQSSLWEQRDPLNLNPNYPYDLSNVTTEEGSNIIRVIIKSDLSGNTNFNLDNYSVGSKVVIKEVDASGNIPQIPIGDYTIKGVITDWLYTTGGATSDVNSFTSSNPPWGVKLAIKVSSISRTPRVATSGTLDYVIDLFDTSEKLYEFKLPRFSHRYKYEDGEYSHFAPWTSVAFKPGSFDYHPKKGYNLGMTNLTQTVHLKDFVSNDMPEDVVEIDILYKEEKSPNVYIVDTFKPDDHATVSSGTGFSNNWNLNKYEISKESIMSILPSNQILRPYDNVPRKALAQDITGNRVVYGNYIQNYNLDAGGIGYKPHFYHGLVNDDSTLKSIKSLREYQLGVVFTDKYGRETPVITNDTGTFKVDKSQGVNKNKIQVSLNNNTNPLDMEFFKLYIKETSGEYYNMAMDRWYDAGDGNVWVSFNSADRNKINDDTILVLKKGVDSDELVEDPARFKVVAIENEAPDFIKLEKTIISDKVHGDTSVATNIFLTGGDLPKEGSSTFSIAYHDSGTHIYSNTVIKDIYNKAQHQGEEFYFQIMNGDGTLSTKPIKIAKINITDENWETTGSGDLTKFDIVLEKPFTSLLNSFTDDTSGANVNKILDGNRAIFLSYKKENKAEFDGRFFVKLFEEDTFKKYIIDNTTAEITQYNASFDQKVYSFDYAKHTLVWNGASGSMPLSVLDYSISANNSSGGGLPNWTDYITVTDNIAQDGSSGSSTDRWKICAAFFRGINIHKGYPSTTPGFDSHGVNKRKQFGAMDLHGGTASDYDLWEFEDVWFLDGVTSQGEYTGNWDGSPNSNNHNGIGITGNTVELGFGGIQPEEIASGFGWSYSNSGGTNDSDVYSLSKNKLYDNDSEASGLANALGAGVFFRWAEDPTQTVYQINNRAVNNLVRHETSTSLNNSNQLKCARGDTGANIYLLNGDNSLSGTPVRYATSTFFRPGNHTRNYTLTISQASDPNNTAIPWNPYTSGEIAGSIVLALTANGGMSLGGNQLTLNSLTAVDSSGFGYGAKTLEVGMVCEISNDLRAVVSKIVDKTIYFKNYNSNVANPTYPSISDGDVLTFKQYGMNGISRNSARNINYWNNGEGFSATNVGVDAVGYTIEIVEPEVKESLFPRFPAIFETEPTEESGLDIYYEITDNLPVTITKENISNLVSYGSQVAILAQDPSFGYQDGFTVMATNPYAYSSGRDIVVNTYLGSAPIVIGDEIIIKNPNGTKLNLLIEDITDTSTSPLRTIFKVSSNLINQRITPNWFNCYSFGNGVESNRVRDAFNKTYISNGVKVSAVLDEPYKEENRKYGLIYSGIYNSTSGVNNLNQFIAAEKITKDINPVYGSIQKLHSGWGQGGDLVTLCEDRVLKILANKDALFNADGDSNVTSTNAVLGQAIPYSGEFGISKNPESFASDAYRAYFTDKVRGAVMRLSMDGLTPISEHGMKDWFRDNLKLGGKIIGSYDDRQDEYNVNIVGASGGVVSFSERAKGWVSFKSFSEMEDGISCANNYYTFKSGNLYRHHDTTVDRNTFYPHYYFGTTVPGNYTDSSFTVLINQSPGSVKTFHTLNYEGSKSKIDELKTYTTFQPGTTIPSVTYDDSNYYNLSNIDGWYVQSIKTDLEEGSLNEFIEKEGKWFNYIKGIPGSITDGANMNGFSNYNVSFQGLGRLTGNPSTSAVPGCTSGGVNPTNGYPNFINYNPAATYDNGSCIATVPGCTDINAFNYTAGGANFNIPAGDPGACEYHGCTDATANNYNSMATIDDGSCTYDVYGCMDFGTQTVNGVTYNTSSNSNTSVTMPCDGSNGILCTADEFGVMQTITSNPLGCCCNPVVPGCTNSLASNFNATANTDDGSCLYINPGCIDLNACNYDPLATSNTNPTSCGYCNDIAANNYDNHPSATCDTYCVYCNQVDNYASFSAGPNEIQIQWNESIDAPLSTYEIEYAETGTNNWSSPPIYQAGGVDGTSISVVISGLTPSTDYDIRVRAVCVTGQSPHNPTYFTTSPWAQLTRSTISAGVLGCTDFNACNYYAAATIDDGSCVLPDGCTDVSAFNYDASAQCDDGSCIATVNGCTDNTQFNYNPNANTDDGSCIAYIYGCTNSAYLEYNPVANTDDTTCTNLIVLGCTSPSSFNYNPSANTDDGGCIATVLGCMDPTATNYNPLVNTDLGNCTYPVGPGCLDPDASNYNANATVSNNSCVYVGCMDPAANNYYGGATGVTNDDGSCEYTGCTDTSATNTTYFTNPYDNQSYIAVDDDGSCIYPVLGCTDTTASNYDAAATLDDGGCIYLGCTDATADNYDASADMDDGSCHYTYYTCADPNANNFLFGCGLCLGTIIDDGSCTYTGCTDPTANNYSSFLHSQGTTYYATTDDGSCTYNTGCTDATADNYDSNAVVDDGSCAYGCQITSPLSITMSNYDQNVGLSVSWNIGYGADIVPPTTLFFITGGGGGNGMALGNDGSENTGAFPISSSATSSSGTVNISFSDPQNALVFAPGNTVVAYFGTFNTTTLVFVDGLYCTSSGFTYLNNQQADINESFSLPAYVGPQDCSSFDPNLNALASGSSNSNISVFTSSSQPDPLYNTIAEGSTLQARYRLIGSSDPWVYGSSVIGANLATYVVFTGLSPNTYHVKFRLQVPAHSSCTGGAFNTPWKQTNVTIT